MSQDCEHAELEEAVVTPRHLHHPGKIAELVPEFSKGVRYYLSMLEDGDNPIHSLGHIEELCREFGASVRAEWGRLKAESDA